MSRRDITYILQKLSLDHRTSLAEKACAFLQAAESNRTIKSHSSHAAICVDIAAKAYAAQKYFYIARRGSSAAQ